MLHYSTDSQKCCEKKACSHVNNWSIQSCMFVQKSLEIGTPHKPLSQTRFLFLILHTFNVHAFVTT